MPETSVGLGNLDEHRLLEQAIRVFHLSTEITALENPAAIPLRVVEALVQELGMPAASIVLADADTGKLVYAAEKGVPPEVKAMGFREGGIAMTVFRSGEAHFVEDMGHDPAANPQARPFFHAYACLPIRCRDATFGLIFVNYGEPHRFSPAERNILRTFANQTAIALDNARLRRAERQRSAALAALANLGRDLTRSLDQEELMRVLERTIRDQIPAFQCGAVWLREEDRLQLKLLFGFFGQGAEPRSLSANASSLQSLGEAGGLALVSSGTILEGLGLPMEPSPPGVLAGEELVLSLRTPEGLEGMIGLILGGLSANLGEAELDFLRTLGDRAALALHNARLYANIRRSAERDGLTQLLNRATFMLRLQESLEEALDKGQTLALLMLDADHFKRCNDLHGHAFGDQVLVALASAIQLQVRQTDGVGRLGGEEFAVLLPAVDLEKACEVAERIRAAIEVLRMHLPDGSQVPGPTVSLGIALAPAHGRDPAQLLLRADEALYKAKAGGRNRICVAAALG